jgi:hypothetical protein
MEETMKSIRLFGTEVIPRIGRIGEHATNGRKTLRPPRIERASR